MCDKGCPQIAQPSAMQDLLMAQERIKALKNELKAWQAAYDRRLATVLETATFAEDRFSWIFRPLTATHHKGESYREGDVKLIRSPRIQRTIRRDDFIMACPEVFNRIAKIPLQQAEAAIGREALDSLCDTTISYSYTAISMDKPGDLE